MEISIQIPADLHKLFAEKADILTKKGYPTRVAALWAAIYIENYTTQLQERNECLIEMFGNDLLNNYEAVEKRLREILINLKNRLLKKILKTVSSLSVVTNTLTEVM